jgi:ABC-type polysaccharide/polyol phosphate transport system ATPase subunit
VSERGNVLLLKMTFKALRNVSLTCGRGAQVAILGSLTSPAMSKLPRIGWIPNH